RCGTRAAATARESVIPTATESSSTAATRRIPTAPCPDAGTGRMTRPELVERYKAIPLPTTKDEHWRFTDLAGFDPDAWTANGAASVAAPPSILELDVAGVASVGEGGIEIEGAPDEIRFAPLPEDHELLYSLVGWDEKFAAH